MGRFTVVKGLSHNTINYVHFLSLPQMTCTKWNQPRC